MTHRIRSFVARRRLVAAGVTGILVGIAAVGTPAVAAFMGTTTSQTMSIATGAYSCFTRTPADNPSFYYAYDESSGSSLVDSGSNGNTGTINGGTRTSGTCAGGTSPALSVASGDGGAVSPRVTSVPTSFTTETWFKTTTTSGGNLIDFGDSASGASSSKDRIVYMTNSGTLAFGIYDGSTEVIASQSSYNDGAWHLMDAVLSSTGGMALYVDGVSVASDTVHTVAENRSSGYWRIGYDNINGWPAAPSSYTFIGSLEDTAVYNTALTSAQINAHMGASEVAPCTARNPIGSPYFYYSYNQVSGSSITDSSGSGNTASLSGGTVSSVSCANGASPVLTLTSGDTGASVGAAAISTTQPITLETWFKTTTTSGGWLMGLGGSAPGLSSTRDRILYMTNSGQLTWYAYDNSNGHSVATTGSYNDGNWHQVIVTMTAASGSNVGSTIYVDGAQVARDSTITLGQTRSSGAYWRIGYDNMGGLSTSNTFIGSLDDTAIYLSALTPSQVTAHFAVPR